MLVIMAGLPGTGKSTLAREIASRTGGTVLDKDSIRAALFGAEVEYTAEQDDFVMSAVLQTSAWLLARRRGRVVIIDGRVFSRNAHLARVIDFAEKLGVAWRVIECTSSEDTARRRLEGDAASGRHVAGNRTWALYQEVRSRFEPIPEPKIVVNTDGDLLECAAQAMAALR
jgi:predicted kinase